VSTELKLMAAQAALQKMLAESSFSICTIDRIADMMGIKPNHEAYSILRTLHCVNYNQMPADLLEKLPELICSVLSSPAFEASRINVVQDGNVLRLVRHD
jgi:hypothetical protein